MNPLAVLIAAAILAVCFHGPAHGGGASHSHGGGGPAHPGGSPPQAAAQAHAMAAQQHAALMQQHAYQQAVRQQAMVQQHMIQQNQQAIHEQLKAQILAHPAAGRGHPATSVPPASALPGAFALGSSGYLASPHHYYHAPSHYYSHHHYYHRHRPYRHRSNWPGTQDPEYAALVQLRENLDDVPPRSARWGAGGDVSHRSAIERSLMRVVEVNQSPSVGSINRLAGDLEEALASRTQKAVDTGTLALALRGAVNDAALIAAERAEVVRELEATLKQGGVPAPRVAAVVASLHEVGRQEHVHHARR